MYMIGRAQATVYCSARISGQYKTAILYCW